MTVKHRLMSEMESMSNMNNNMMNEENWEVLKKEEMENLLAGWMLKLMKTI